MRRSSLLLGFTLMVLVGMVQPREASACQRCKFVLDCSTPECDIVLKCQAPRYPERGYPDCDAVDGSCGTDGTPCTWAHAPAGEAELFAFYGGQNRSSLTKVQQCPALLAL